MLIGMFFVIIWEMFHRRISLNSVLLLLANFVSGFRLEFICPSSKASGQASLISTIFSCLCCCHISYKSLFCLYQQNKSSESQVKFRRASNHCKMVLKVANLHMLIKQKSPSLTRHLALGTFGELLTVLSTRVTLLYLLYSTASSSVVFCIW